MRVQLAGLDWAQLSAWSEAEIDARLRVAPPTVRGVRAPIDLPWVHRELRRKSVTLQLLWEEYRDPDRCSSLQSNVLLVRHCLQVVRYIHDVLTGEVVGNGLHECGRRTLVGPLKDR